MTILVLLGTFRFQRYLIKRYTQSRQQNGAIAALSEVSNRYNQGFMIRWLLIISFRVGFDIHQ